MWIFFLIHAAYCATDIARKHASNARNLSRPLNDANPASRAGTCWGNSSIRFSMSPRKPRKTSQKDTSSWGHIAKMSWEGASRSKEGRRWRSWTSCCISSAVMGLSIACPCIKVTGLILARRFTLGIFQRRKNDFKSTSSFNIIWHSLKDMPCWENPLVRFVWSAVGVQHGQL